MLKEEVREVLSRKPFNPVRLVLKDSRTFDVELPDAARLTAHGVLVFIGMKEGTRQAQRHAEFGFDSIARIEPLPSISGPDPAKVRCSFCGDNVLERHAMQGSDE